jgi:DME family drug/metabolite transporter
MANQISGIKCVFAIVLASIFWGTTGTAASFSPDIGPFAIGAFSMGVGGLLLVATAHKKLLRDYKCILSQPKILIFGSACVAIYPLAFYTSMRFSGVAVGTVVSIASAPFFAAILERLISKKNISLQWMFSFLIGAIGIVFLALGKAHNNDALNTIYLQHVGILLGLLAGLTYASYSWAAKHLIDSGVHSQSSIAALFGFAAIALLPSLWFTGENLFATRTNVAVSLYMAIIPMFFGYLLFSFGLELIEASRATLITLIEPLLATILADYIIGEGYKPIGWLGVGLVSLCLMLQSFNVERLPKISFSRNKAM